jgi:hypothetical protein
MKHAYGFRSKVVHGSPVRENDLEKVAETSEFCDSSLRTIIFRIMTDETTRLVFEKEHQSFDEHMLNMIFSVGA